MKTRIVLDASAVLAHLCGEPGGEIVEACLPTGLVSAVNLTEIATRLLRSGDDPGRALRLGCEVADHDADLAYEAALLWPATMSLGLSLGDRACLALAQREDLPVLTADRAWERLTLAVDIRLIR